MDTLNTWITHYGYFGIFALLVFGIVGLPVPDETLLTLTGYLVYKGELHLGWAFSSALLGSMTGITFSYVLGKTFGLYIFKKYGRFFHITDERLDKTHDWFERFGKWSLLFGYFIPGVRHFVAIIAGTSKLELWKFTLFAYSGAFIWASTFFSIGYFFGEKWDIILHQIEKHIIIISIIAAVCLILFYIFRKKIIGRGKTENKVES
jgi:membrane protein DedA with SNARE-associated domain